MSWGFRIASSSRSGLGHLARSLALARQLSEPVTLYLDADGIDTDLVTRGNWRVEYEPSSTAVSSLHTHAEAGLFGAAVFDGYDYNAADVQSVTKKIFTAAIRDDLGTYPVDSILRHGLLGALDDTEIGGPNHALLDECWLAARVTALDRQAEDSGKRIVVGFGAVDSQNLTEIAVRAAQLNDAESICVVLPACAPHFHRVSEVVSDIPQAYILPAMQQPEEVYLAADISIGSAGVSLLERACCGLPSLLVLQNASQGPNADSAIAHGIAELASSAPMITSKEIALKLALLLEDPSKLGAMREACLETVDGNGASRVANWLRANREKRAAVKMKLRLV